MKKISYISVVLLSAAFLLGCSISRHKALNNHVIITDKLAEAGGSSNMKFYRYTELGYEIAYPNNYKISISGGHSPSANPELGMRLSLYSIDRQPYLDIDSIDKINYKDWYQNIESYLKYKGMHLKLEEVFVVNGRSNKVYKLNDEDYYFSFLENEELIFQLSSSSKDLLKKIMRNFKFI